MSAIIPITEVGPTTVDVYSADQWARRLVKLFPRTWTSDAAKRVGGVLYSICNAVGSTGAAIQAQFQFCLNAERLTTATDIALDSYANDLFIDLPRLTGEPDDSYRARIIANLFPERGTLPAITKMFTQLTGQAPRLIEPWNITDCAVLDRSFVDIDTVAYPSRTADTAQHKIVLLESILPSFGNQGTVPVYGLDAGLVVDFGWIVDSQPTWFLQSAMLDNALTQTKMGGTRAYRRYSSQSLCDYFKAGTTPVYANSETLPISVAPEMAGPYVVVACPSWNTVVSVVANSQSQFTLVFSTPPSNVESIDWMIAPLTVTNAVNDIVNQGVETASFPMTNFSGMLPFASCGWNAQAILASISGGNANFAFNAPSNQTSQIGCIFLPSSQGGIVTVSAGQDSYTITLPTGITTPFQAFVMPSWNTSVAVIKNGTTSLTVEFSDAPPASASLYWAIQQTTPGAVV